jgi:3-dehydroquinate synthase
MSLPLTVRHAGGSYDVRFGPLERIGDEARACGLGGTALVVTDANVGPLYAQTVADALAAGGFSPHVLMVEAGEATKSARHLERVYDQALALGIDRKTTVFALGGGVVGDLAGYAAATLLRGLPLVQVPTTSISQVDSAIGGKTGINHSAGKNLIGAFWPPRLVYADPATLQTLPRREWTSGLAEAVKHALLSGSPLLDELLDDGPALLDRAPQTVARLVPLAASVKVGVVSADEREAGRRAFLNLGHTFGHALEATLGYGVLTHGEAVALGMKSALWLSEQLGGPLDPRAHRALDLLPTPRPDLPPLGDLLTAMRADKKSASGRIQFVLLRAVGDAYLTADVTEAAIGEAFEAAFRA